MKPSIQRKTDFSPTKQILHTFKIAPGDKEWEPTSPLDWRAKVITSSTMLCNCTLSFDMRIFLSCTNTGLNKNQWKNPMTHDRFVTNFNTIIKYMFFGRWIFMENCLTKVRWKPYDLARRWKEVHQKMKGFKGCMVTQYSLGPLLKKTDLYQTSVLNSN